MAAHTAPPPKRRAGDLPSDVRAGLDAIARVSRALLATRDLPELAASALAETRETLGLEHAALFVPESDAGRTAVRYADSPAPGAELRTLPRLRFDEEAWALVVSGGRPVVLRERAGWLVDHPFEPPVDDWIVLPLAGSDGEPIGLVVGAARAPIATDPMSATVLALVAGQLGAGIATARARQALERAALERERMRLAADVHDGLAQDLAAALRELALLDAGPETASAARDRLRAAIESANGLVRSHLHDLTVTVGATGLRGVLEHACAPFRARGLDVRLRVEGPDDGAGPAVAALAMRVAAEALANAARHSGCASVDVAARVDSEELELCVSDDGRGFDPAAAPGPRAGHFGLRIMRERAETLGGMLEIADAAPGAVVRLRVPPR